LKGLFIQNKQGKTDDWGGYRKKKRLESGTFSETSLRHQFLRKGDRMKKVMVLLCAAEYKAAAEQWGQTSIQNGKKKRRTPPV